MKMPNFVTVAVTKKNTLEPKSGHWVALTDGQDGKTHSVEESYAGRDDFYWSVWLNLEKREINCMARGVYGTTRFIKTFPLQVGTVVLSDLHTGLPEETSIWASFRPYALQKLMDQYRLESIRRIDPNRASRQEYDGFDNLRERILWVKTDGRLAVVQGKQGEFDCFEVADATWAIIEYEAARGDNRRILYTRRKLTSDLEASFWKCDVYPFPQGRTTSKLKEGL